MLIHPAKKLAFLTGEKAYDQALDKIWKNIVHKKIYLTGGIGAEPRHEGFGPNYELPNATAYTETCAAIALMLWNHRMFLRSGDVKFMDVFERTLYNGFLAGVSLEGNTFFYPNPLEVDGVTKFNQGVCGRSPGGAATADPSCWGAHPSSASSSLTRSSTAPAPSPTTAGTEPVSVS